jgi:hypothetical protein
MSTDLRATRDSPSSDDLPLFRFGMRQLLAFVSLVSLLMAGMATFSGLIALVLLLATLVVSFHLFSTALGTQLRWHANRKQSQSLPTPAAAQPFVPRPALPDQRSPWHKCHSTPLPWRLRWILLAWLLGTLVGAMLLSGTIGHRSSVAGVAVGAFSVGVIAAWFAFIGYSFYGVFRHGLRDAMAKDAREGCPVNQRD